MKELRKVLPTPNQPPPPQKKNLKNSTSSPQIKLNGTLVVICMSGKPRGLGWHKQPELSLNYFYLHLIYDDYL